MNTYVILYVEKDDIQNSHGYYWEIVGDTHFRDVVIDSLITKGYRIVDIIIKK